MPKGRSRRGAWVWLERDRFRRKRLRLFPDFKVIPVLLRTAGVRQERIGQAEPTFKGRFPEFNVQGALSGVRRSWCLSSFPVCILQVHVSPCGESRPAETKDRRCLEVIDSRQNTYFPKENPYYFGNSGVRRAEFPEQPGAGGTAVVKRYSRGRSQAEFGLDNEKNGSSIEVSPPIQFRIEWAGSQGMSPLLGRRPI